MHTDTTDHRSDPTCTINLLPPPSETQKETVPPVQKLWCSRTPGPSALVWFLGDGYGFHQWHPGFVPSFPSALGRWRGLRTTLSYFLTFRDAGKHNQDGIWTQHSCLPNGSNSSDNVPNINHNINSSSLFLLSRLFIEHFEEVLSRSEQVWGVQQ